MRSLPIYSTGLRFLQRLGYSLLQATLFGVILGLLVYYRVPRAQLSEEATPLALLARPASWLQAAENVTYDWRARSLGARGSRSDRVVVVALDDETLAEARQDQHAGIASYPWPREILGGLTQRLLDEGAELVLLDLPLTERSPRAPFSPGAPGQEERDDDRVFRSLLDQVPGKSVLAFSWSADRGVPPGSRLWPYRVRLGTSPTEAEARGRVQKILADQRPAFLLPGKGGVEVWAGVASEQEGQRVALEQGVREPPRVQERRISDDVYRVGPLELFISLAEVKVEGLDASQLGEVRQVEHPVAPLLGTASLYGAITLPADPDGVVRAVPHLVSYRGRDGTRRVLPSMPLVAAMLQANTRELRYADGRLYVGDRFSLPMDESGYSLIRWDAAEVGRGSRGSVARAIPAWNVLLNFFAVREGVPPRAAHDIDGRLIVFSNTSRRAMNFLHTPIGERTPTGAVLAQSLVNLLQSESLSRATRRWDLGLTLGMALLGAFVALTVNRGLRSSGDAFLYLFVMAAVGVGYAVGAWYVFVHRLLWVAMVGPLLAMGLTFLFTIVQASRSEQQLRHFITDVLGRYVSPEVARLVTRDLRQLTRPELREVTVFFCDLDGFSRLSGELPPERLVQFLNEYLTEVTDVVRATRGQVDKYMGDAVMAFWGAPVRTERHAHHACEAALVVRSTLLARQEYWTKTYGHSVQCRIGIDSGEVLVGGMGSTLESKYSVLGRSVKFSMYLEGLNRGYGTFVLVGDGVARLAQDGYVFREVDRVRPKGRTESTRLHELVGRKGEVQAAAQAHLSLHEQALTAYHERRFDEALALFTRSVEEFQDPVARVYIERCRVFTQKRPAEDWDGVFVLEGP
ncbi:Adenylate cyclase [Cystobacter fuscus DSM 2262]|uniref:Adenylate cyclase n=1 Tax=Cystobacter fuscus (strain ATCC 25194 / DSM 2262 / NBRC 100088 / M29) TaxID=1242864 RepID=S9PGA7_CYSF2|nr:adenylate/guanylate cyclase domain-containing protein [Cystobacter fuscus]EPX63410.1 Adenylate cyclase [Cystobacter fuscus DSM 2262]